MGPRRESTLEDPVCSRVSPLFSSCDHAEKAIAILICARGEEELIVGPIPAAIETELDRPNIVDLDRIASRVAQWAEECA